MTDVTTVKDDPKRPWKTVAAVAVAIITYLVTQEVVDFPAWVDVTLNAGLTGLAVFFVGNPKIRK